MRTNPFTSFIKSLFLKIWPDSTLLRHLAYLPKFEKFCQQHLAVRPQFEDRFKMYDFISNKVGANADIDYLEFGVFKGETIKYWASLNKNVNSRFFGFDTFEGLPENWTDFRFNRNMSSFDMKGKLPEIDDKRVAFNKGLFQETLPAFLKQYDNNSKQVIIHNDSDLYSSTLFVLAHSDHLLKPGTIIIFDEIWSILHEFRALEDYCSSFMKSYDVIGGTTGPTGRYQEVAIQIQ